jgi:WD40 repeat protein
MLFELLTGERPFRGNIRMLLHQILFDDAPSPRRLNSRIPKDLETVCLKCLEKEPNRRYVCAAELQADLRRFIAGEPVRARPLGKLARAWRFCQRNRALASALAALAFVTVAGFVGVASEWIDAEKQRGRAEQSAEETRAERDRATELARQARQERDAARWQSYRANIAAGSSALQIQDVHLLKRALDAAPSDFRNWEWSYLNGRLDRSFAVLAGHVSSVPRGVGFRGDGSQVFSTDFDETKTWKRASGELLRTSRFIDHSAVNEFVLRNEHSQKSGAVASPDESRIASVGPEGTLRLLDAATQNEIAVLWRANDPFVLPTFSDDGTRIASWCDDMSVRVWDAKTGQELTVLKGRADAVTSLMFSPDGTRVISWVVHRELSWPPQDVRLWDAQSGELVAVLQEGEKDELASLVFSPDGTGFAFGREFPNNRIELRETATGKTLGIMSGHTNRVWSVAFHPDGSRIASASMDGTVRIWDTQTFQQIRELRGHTGYIYRIAFNRDGSRLASA